MANPTPTGPTDALPSPPGLPATLTRRRDGRWLAGVCAGLARQRNLPLSAVRAVFVLAALVGGVGVLVYLACWLIIPADGAQEDGSSGTRWIVVLAQASAAAVGLATLAGLGAGAAIFGFGWIVLVVAAVVLVGALASWPRLGSGWALLPVGALVLPALAMTLGGVRINPASRDVWVAPRSTAGLPTGGYTSGLGGLFVDLRNTAFPAAGNVPLRIDAGIRRTIVALPADRCVYVEVSYDVVPFAARLASIVTGRDEPYSEVTLFGDVEGSQDGEAGNVPAGQVGQAPKYPVLDIDFHSAGGSLYVRDYPNQIDPQVAPDWPGYPVSLEPRPDLVGSTPAAARSLIDGWLLRRRVQSASAAALTRLLPGPCGASGSFSAGSPTTAQQASGPPPEAAIPGAPQATGVPQAPQAPLPPATRTTTPSTGAPAARSQTTRPQPAAARTTRTGTARSATTRRQPARSATTRPRADRSRRAGSRGGSRP